MYKKVLVAVLMLALLAGGVGLGIHLLHKEALANVTYKIYVNLWDDDEEVWVTLPNRRVNFDFDEEGDFDEWTDAGGKAVHVLDDWHQGFWDALYDGAPPGTYRVWLDDSFQTQGPNPAEVGGTVDSYVFFIEPLNNR